MTNPICPLYNEYHEPLRWIFTEPLGTCIYNIFDEFSFIIGWLSVLSWTFALLPQIITNCKNKAAESQSFWFWLLWLVGDICNFAGCILTKNLVTNIALALVYLSLTIFACLQFIWYEYIMRKYKYEKQRQLNINHPPPFDIEIGPSPSYNNKSRKSNTASSSGAAIYNTPKFAQQYHHKVPKEKMSPKLRATVNVISRSPRMFAVSPHMTSRVRKEYLAFQARRRRQQQNNEQYVDFESDEEEEEEDDEETSGSVSTEDSEQAHKSKSRIKVYEDYNAITPQQNVSKMYPHSNGKIHPQPPTRLHSKSMAYIDRNSLPLRGTKTADYGSTSTIISTLSTMSATIIMLYGFTNHNNSEYGINDNNSLQRRLLAHIEVTPTSQVDVLLMIGMILGWVSSFIYVSSRIPQLRLMMSKKDVAGINPLFFCLTFSGNLTQCLSMIINKQIYFHRNEFMSKLPWLVSSGVCVFQDGFILFLIYLYKGYASKSQFSLLSIDKYKVIDATISRSKGVMMPSSYSIITEKQQKRNKKKKKKRKRKKTQKRKVAIEDKQKCDAKGIFYKQQDDTPKNNKHNQFKLTNTV